MSTPHNPATDAFLKAYMHSLSGALQALPWEQLDAWVERLHQARLCQAQVFIGGNGGSAATASHMVNDLNKGANALGVPRLRAIGLNDNVPLFTAWSNDDGYATGMAEPLRNLARPGDLFIGISCSGNSSNVVAAAHRAHELGLTVLGMTGNPSGELARIADLPLVVAADCIEAQEDAHMALEHAIVSALRERAQRELVPGLLLADGRGATPQSPAVTHRDAPQGAIFLDRDGVINANRDDHVKSWEELALLPGVLKALRNLARLPWPIVVVTNQASINRGLLDYQTSVSMHLRLMRLVADHGGRIDALVWCPHRAEEGCGCRKPKAGMFAYAAAALQLDLSRSYMVGDAASDVEASQSAGLTPLLVRTGRWGSRAGQTTAEAPCRVLPDLASAVECILVDVPTRWGQA